MKYYIFIIVSCLIGHYALAQTAPDTNLLTKTWKAGWIGVTEGPNMLMVHICLKSLLNWTKCLLGMLFMFQLTTASVSL